MLKKVLFGAGLFCILTVLLPLVVWDRWWGGIFDYPRLQLTLLSIVILAFSALVLNRQKASSRIYLLLLGMAVIYQFYLLLPYTALVTPVVARMDADTTSVRLLISNVWIKNRTVEPYLNLVRTADPDVVLVIEPDAWWQERLEPLRAQYPTAIEIPHDNAFGINLYSRIPLETTTVQYLETANIPLIYTELLLTGGDRVAFYGLHTRPMHPAIHVPFEERALLQVARQARTSPHPVIVAGDFNYVPWSYTLQRFQELSGLNDPRVGHGFYPTYHARHPLLGFPIDHVYVSNQLALARMERLPAYGSDHFALLVTLSVTKPETSPNGVTPALQL